MIGNTETKEYEFEFVNSEDGSIDFDKVQKLMLRTMNNDMTQRDYLANAALGLCGELGEVLNVVQQVSELSEHRDKLKLELGDMCWYLFLFSRVLGISPKTIFPTLLSSKYLDHAGNIYQLTRTVLDLADTVKKMLYHSANLQSEFDKNKLDSVGMSLCFIGGTIKWLVETAGFNLAEILQANIDKLAKRHKGGKFSSVLQDAKLDEVEGNE